MSLISRVLLAVGVLSMVSACETGSRFQTDKSSYVSGDVNGAVLSLSSGSDPISGNLCGSVMQRFESGVWVDVSLAPKLASSGFVRACSAESIRLAPFAGLTVVQHLDPSLVVGTYRYSTTIERNTSVPAVIETIVTNDFEIVAPD